MQEGLKLSVPAAIVVAGALIAGAIFLSKSNAPKQAAQLGATTQSESAADTVPLAPVGTDDHLLGNPNAPVVLVEYSDLECPFCKDFHKTLHRLIGEYGKDGKVAWVYRHFPLDRLHPKARREAEASECAAELGGNDAFWKYVDRIFEITPSNNGLDVALLPKIAQDIGLNRTLFESCLSSGRHQARVQEDLDDAIRAGGQGTPYSVIIAKDQKIPISQGAIPYATLKQIVDSLLKEASTTF